ncbi:DUF221-domain-containing protein [Saccharata proteae CBS 121410]|uniref:DUF221-domain-containing protein n=1 Tax=Saccharata proteae CBS 121410 TaxID=1314787 RepID=A0A9P4HY22_9PEZI|nr:DUF221-domain-containing protein [Saccharata proteae CBS 121410]
MRGASLSPRAETSSTDTFVNLISDPFSTELDQKSFWSSLGWSVCFAIIFAALFCFLRPYNSAVYAPRLKAADDRHKPPVTKKGFLGWVDPVLKTREQLLVEKIGLDATLFLRFTKMCRNMFLALAFVGCGAFIPINLIVNKGNSESKASAFMRLTPLNLSGSVCWVHVLVAYVFDVIICFFVWTNYKAVRMLRQDYLNSPEYQDSLHSRTLMLTDLPKPMRSVEGIVTLTETVKATDPRPTGVIARNVKELPELIENYTNTVLVLEEVVTKYCKNPKRLPAKRPTMRPYTSDKSYADHKHKVDAIEYLSNRLAKLRTEIEHVRESVDQRDPLPYGFASYETIEQAHLVAYSVGRKHPQGATIRLAPKPTDIIWKNLPLSKNDRRWRGFVNFGWYLLLTLAWNIPNGLIAIFVANLSNLGQVWPAFQTELNKDPTLWAIIQGILAPLLLTTFYMLLPTIFRRISINAGDYSKTGRERHVIAKLYFFFTFNNLFVYSLFGAVWKYVATVQEASKHEDTLTALEAADIFGNSMTALCQVSTYWLNYLVSRNLGAAYDISQLSSLAWGSLLRKFATSTPRKIAQSTAPPLFDYASYFNYFLFYVTVALVFAPFQPLVLLVALAYFTLDTYLKKYLLLYVFSTRHESGGLYWRVIINRLLISAFLANVVMALLVTSKGGNWGPMLATMAPLPLLLLGYKYYLTKYFDVPIKFYNQGPQHGKKLGGLVGGEASLPERKHRPGNLRQRFGHPALNDELMAIMVPSAVKELLPKLYEYRAGLSTFDRPDSPTNDAADFYDSGAADSYSLTDFSRSRPGAGKHGRFATLANQPSSVPGAAPFEFIDDDQMSFTNFKHRPEFREAYGGDGEMYGRPSDLSRPGTPGTFVSRSGAGTPVQGFRAAAATGPGERMASLDSERTVTDYPEGYHYPPSQGLVDGAAPMGRRTPEFRSSPPPSSRGSPERGGRVGLRGGAGGRYERVETPDEEDEFLGYDYFRRGGGRG